MVLADSHRIPLTPWYLGYFRELTRFRLHGFHALRLIFPDHLTNKSVSYSLAYCKFALKSHNTYGATIAVFNTPKGLGSFPFARRYSGNHGCFLFLQVLRCFSSLGWLCYAYVFSIECTDITLYGLLHSEIPGS
jgi:hypothetical protein